MLSNLLFRSKRALVGVALFVVASIGPAFVPPQLAPEFTTCSAQEEKSAGEDRATSFRNVTGATTEDIAGGPLLIAAYAVILVLLFLYVIRLGKLHTRTLEDLSRLEKSLKED